MTVIDVTDKWIKSQDAALLANTKTESQIWGTWKVTTLICCGILLWDYTRTWAFPTVLPWVVGFLLTVLGGTFLYTTLDLMVGTVGSNWTTFPKFFVPYLFVVALMAMSVYLFSIDEEQLFEQLHWIRSF